MRKSTDIRVIKTQKALLKALEDLIQTKKLSCISITELCNAAKINRNTFYYHYNNVYDLLEDNKKILLDEINEIMDVSRPRSKETIYALCKVLSNHPCLLRILISPNCELDFFDEIFGITAEKTRILMDKHREIKSSSENLIVGFCNAGYIAVLRSWIQNGMQEPADDIADIIDRCCRCGPITMLFPGN